MRNIWLPILLVTLSSDLVVVAQQRQSNTANKAESDNFRVYSFTGGPSALQVAKKSEHLRTELQRIWLGEEPQANWSPRCDIVLHRSRASYQQAVGGGAQTSGSSLIRYERGQMRVRRVDLLVDARGEFTAMPHELTHVVLSDRFEGRQPPRWVDEGIATMADSHAKRKLHHRDCQYALRNGNALRMIEILKLEEFTSAEQVPPFYGQSLSLVNFLFQHDEPTAIVDFVDTAMQHGYDHALRTHYAIDGVTALEQKWRSFAKTAVQREAQLVSYRPQQ